VFIRIKALTEGIRRAGMAHYGEKSYPLDTFTKEQVEALENEPRLKVVISNLEKPPASAAQAEEPLREDEPPEVLVIEAAPKAAPSEAAPSEAAPEATTSGAETKKSKGKK
jgi:hypothetical protein